MVIIASLGDSLVTFRAELLQQLVGRGCRVLALAPELSPATRQWLALRGILFAEAPLSRTGTSVVQDLRFFVWVATRIHRARPRVVLAYTVKPVVYGMLAALGTSAHRYALITGLGYAFTDGRGERRAVRRVLEWLYRVALLGVDGVFFQNPDDQAFFRKNRLLMPGVRSVVLAGSGVDIAQFAQRPVRAEAPTFLLIARLLGDKGVREYVEAGRLVKRRHPNVVFQLAGWIDSNPDAIHEDELAGWVREGVVKYLGKLDDVRPALECCTVYVLPSYREGTPRTVLEAMAVGRAIITTNAPGCRETVTDGLNGFLIDPKSVPQLVEAMERFVREPDLTIAMGRESRRLAEHKYDARRVSAIMLDQMGIESP